MAWHKRVVLLDQVDLPYPFYEIVYIYYIINTCENGPNVFNKSCSSFKWVKQAG